jgi:callose synthase
VKAVRLPRADDEEFFAGLARLHAILTTRGSLDAVPRNADARRRVAFFANSLFMDMPRAPPVPRMRAFSVLTPYYSEDVAYSRDQLRTPNGDGITVLFYLQSVFPDEWENFVERMGPSRSVDDLWNDKDTARRLRMWASYRGQTLARTVRGISYYLTALETLAALDSVSEVKHSSTPPPAIADAAKGMAIKPI